MNEYDLTEEEALTLRRAARVMTKLSEHTLAVALDLVADDADAPNLCEACDAPGTTSDAEGVPLCQTHFDALVAESECDDAECPNPEPHAPHDGYSTRIKPRNGDTA